MKTEDGRRILRSCAGDVKRDAIGLNLPVLNAYCRGITVYLLILCRHVTIEVCVDRMENHEWDITISARLIVCVARVDMEKQRPEPLAFGGRCLNRANTPTRRANLNQRFRTMLEIKPPCRMLPGATIRGNQHEDAVDRKIEQRGGS